MVLALATYVPLLSTAPGRVVADTKTYLYLDPGRLLSRAWSMWDPNVGLGTVSHQTIGYLWPMGPWYWTFDHLGVPDWVAQRLWLATILFAAGAGVLWLLRRVLGWATASAAAAGAVYAFTPYVLTLAARLSVILLPFAGLPWMIGLTALALRQSSAPRARDRWRYPAAFALVVATVGSVNATALVLAGLGPLLWLAYARLSGEASAGTLARTVGRIGVLTVAANLWWIAGLWAQGQYGIEILRYTETAETVAQSSVANEILRGLGYWFFYGGDRLGPWIEPGRSYTQRLPILLLTYGIPILALLAGTVVRWRERAFFVALVVVGVVVAVGAHPWENPPPGGALVKALLETDAGLAMRSLPRATPLVVLGLAALLGAGVGALARRWRWPAAVAVAVAAYAALPPLWTGGMVPSNLDRAEDVPGYWHDVTTFLDGRGEGTRVLAIPGIDFASYRWGNTVDPIAPGMMDRPFAARELIPYGSPPSAELLGALDRRLQEGVLDPGTLAVVARFLGVGDVLHRADLQYERYRTPRPYHLAPQLAAEPGLGDPVGFGEPRRNQAVPEVPLIDERALLSDDGQPRHPVEVLPVLDPVPIVRAKPAGGGVVLAGDGEGLVEVAGTGLLDGDELVRYAADLGRDGVTEALDDGAALVVTDWNRRQGQRWSTVRDVLGFVEGEPVLEDDPTDNRLPVFPDAEEGWQTTAAPVGGVRVAATSYGNPISFTPEYRPANAVDGDVRTEWRTGANSDVRGERLVLTYDPPVRASSATFVQQLSGFRNRHITEIAVSVDGGEPVEVALDERSLTPDGQEVALPADGPISRLEVEILADSSGREGSWGRPARFGGLTQVGFAEIRVDGAGGEPEALVLPPAATAAIGPDTPVALVLARWRTDPAEAVRTDPEPALARNWSQPVPRTFTLDGVARPSPRAPGPVLDDLLGVTGPEVAASSRLPGALRERASAAFDGDPSTWWSPAFDDPEPALSVRTARPVTFDQLDVAVVDDGRRSVPTRIRIEVDGVPVATVPPGPTTLPEPVTGTSFRFVVEEVAERTAIEWFSDAPIAIPPAIADIGVPALAVEVPAVDGLDVACRSDLLTLDGEPVPVRVVDGAVEACGGPLAIGAGDHELRAAAGWDTGIDLDRLVLSSGLPADLGAGAHPAVEVLDEGRDEVRVQVRGATPGEPFWLVLGQSYNDGWSLDGQAPELVDGYANGWLVTPESSSLVLTMRWRPQRVVDAALAVSAAGVLGCIALLVLGRRRRPGGAAPGRVGGRVPRGAWLRARRRWVVPVVAGAASLVWIGPLSAAVVAAAAAAGARWDRARALLRLGPSAVLGLVAAYVLARQAVAQPTAAFEWPAELATGHQPALVAVALLATVVALDALDPLTPDASAAPASSPSAAASPPAGAAPPPGSAASDDGADRP